MVNFIPIFVWFLSCFTSTVEVLLSRHCLCLCGCNNDKFLPSYLYIAPGKREAVRSLLEEAARNQQTQKMEVDRLKTQVRRYHGSKCHHLRQKLVKATRYREFDYHSYIQLVIGCFVSCPTMEFVMLRLQEKPLEV